MLVDKFTQNQYFKPLVPSFLLQGLIQHTMMNFHYAIIIEIIVKIFNIVSAPG